MESAPTDPNGLDAMDHIAIEVANVSEAVAWYTERFRCRVKYQDETWALLLFSNIRLALVTRGQHRPHVGFRQANVEKYGPLKTHRDGERYVYVEDPAGNVVEFLAAD
jgi:catechol 2,3-dioxygenase-like lactoylglutathione lyase family enzyme